MASKKQIMELAKKLNATLVVNKDGITCEAPAGYLWNCADIHELVLDYEMLCEEGGQQSDAVEMVYKDMTCGLRKCDIENCEWCADNEKLELSAKTPK